MSERLLRVLLSEIKTLRIVCQKCKTVVEVPVEKLDTKFTNGACRFCGETFRSEAIPDSDLLGKLGNTLTLLRSIENHVQIEISIPLD